MIKKPSSPLPFSVEEEVDNTFLHQGIQHIKCADQTYMGFLFTDRKSPEYTPHDVELDTQYLVTAANDYPEMVELLERLESTTKDKDTAKRISDYLKNKKIWN